MSSWISPKARKGVESGIAGRGLVAHEAIDAGEVVAVKGGHIVTTQALHGLSESLQNSEIQVADGLHLVAHTPEEYEAVMVFINHSCEPNVGFGGNTVLLAISAVAAGVELTTDYALFDDYTGQMTCRCGTASCRGTIDGTGAGLTCSGATPATSPGTSSAKSTPCRKTGSRTLSGTVSIFVTGSASGHKPPLAIRFARDHQLVALRRIRGRHAGLLQRGRARLPGAVRAPRPSRHGLP